MTALALTPNGVQRSSLSNFLEEWFDNDFMRSGYRNQPSTNLIEHDDHFMIELSVPGHQKKDFEIQVDHNQLTISTKKEEESTTEKENYKLREFSKYQFSRSFSLANTIDSSRITATCDNGVLAIHLPKKEEAKRKPPRKIDIK